MIQFTERCEEGIRSHGLHNLQKELEQQLEGYTNVDLGSGESSGGEQDTAMHVLDLKLKALILDTIHNIDVIEQLIASNVKQDQEWLWQKQLR